MVKFSASGAGLSGKTLNKIIVSVFYSVEADMHDHNTFKTSIGKFVSIPGAIFKKTVCSLLLC